MNQKTPSPQKTQENQTTSDKQNSSTDQSTSHNSNESNEAQVQKQNLTSEIQKYQGDQIQGQQNQSEQHQVSEKEAASILESAENKGQGQEEEEDEKTLSQFLVECEQNDKLQSQLMKNRYVNKCRYEDGYIYQQVYSCLTCYQEQIKNLPEDQRQQVEKGLQNNGELINYVKPHGFCLGCMLNCHEGHEVVELYSKLDFRCDCGNGRMPFSCQLNNNKEDYENEKNNYNQNFFDCYCYCKKPHSFEYVDQFMIQCYECEDWFHNQHLKPQIIEDSLDEKYFLLCKDCVDKKYKGKILQYQRYFHNSTKDNLINENPEQLAKRQRLSDNQEAKVEQRVNCQNEKEDQLEEPFDMLIDEGFIEYLCSCQECEKVFSKVKRLISVTEIMSDEDKKLQNNLEGILNEDDEEDKQEETSNTNEKSSPQKIGDLLTSDNYLNGLMSQTLKKGNLTHEGQIYFAENYIKFKDYFVQFLKQFDNQNKKITQDDVLKFKEGLEHLREKPNKFQ